MSITINVTAATDGSFTASGVDAPSVNLTVSGGIGPPGAGNVALAAGTGIAISTAAGVATISSTASAPTNLASTAAVDLGAAAVGTSSEAARADHVHNLPALADLVGVAIGTPAAGQVLEYNGTAWAPGTDNALTLASTGGADLGTAAAGSASTAARADHVHNLPTFAEITNGTASVTGNLTLNASTGGVIVNGGNSSASLTLKCEQNTHGVTIASPAHAVGATYTLTLPATAGSANQVLTTDGTGSLAWSNGSDVGPGTYVSTLNGLSGSLTLAGDSGITVSQVGSQLRLAIPASVTSINGEDGAITLVGGSNIQITAQDECLTIAAVLTDYATLSFVNQSIANLVDSSPAALDTLAELATALNNDADFAANITNLIAEKANANQVVHAVNGLNGNVTVINGTGLTLAENGSTLTLSAAIPPSNLADLADVSGTPSANDALIYNGTGWQPGVTAAGTTINSLSGNVSLLAGTGVNITTSGSNLTISRLTSGSDIATPAYIVNDGQLYIWIARVSGAASYYLEIYNSSNNLYQAKASATDGVGTYTTTEHRISTGSLSSSHWRWKAVASDGTSSDWGYSSGAPGAPAGDGLTFTNAPLASGSPGNAGDLAYEGQFLFLHNGDQWNRANLTAFNTTATPSAPTNLLISVS